MSIHHLVIKIAMSLFQTDYTYSFLQAPAAGFRASFGCGIRYLVYCGTAWLPATFTLLI
jgi:hypothetical protein